MNKLNDKQKCIIGLALVIIMGFVLFHTYEPKDTNQYTGIIRLHVVANSDREEDQALKLKVRDNILKKMKDLKGTQNINKSREYLNSHLDQMEEIADATLAEGGKTYTAKAELGVRWIPEKTYGDMHFPAGNYEALDVTLGAGKGQNWWCVLFPPLCLIDEDPDTIKELGLTEQDGLQLKSKLIEILEHKKTDRE